RRMRWMASEPGFVTVFPARRILTMNPSRPSVEAVAVRDGRILGAGDLESIQGWLHDGRHAIDRRFEHDVILPGFIDAHMHAQMLGHAWREIFVGFHDRERPDGSIAPGSKTVGAVLGRLEAELAARDDDL